MFSPIKMGLQISYGNFIRIKYKIAALDVKTSTHSLFIIATQGFQKLLLSMLEGLR